jgi:small-conductance mechanosensitive channel
MNFDFSQYINPSTIEKLFRVLMILAIGLAVIYLLAYIAKKLLPARLSKQRIMIINRAIQYTGLITLFFIVISELNINLAAIFGAAGLIGLVIGVASQTSIGNIVSGFFLVSEKSFEIGDVIRIGDKTGTVFSIDLLSIKIRTFDNLLIRIPNQTVISTELTNITRFPIRRMDIDVSVAYKEDLGKVKSVLEKVAKSNPLCLDEPEPLIIFKHFGASGIDVTLGIWFERTNFLKVKNSVFQEIKMAFNAEGIEIPFPHISLYAGEITKPFPVTIPGGEKTPAESQPE